MVKVEMGFHARFGFALTSEVRQYNVITMTNIKWELSYKELLFPIISRLPYKVYGSCRQF